MYNHDEGQLPVRLAKLYGYLTDAQWNDVHADYNPAIIMTLFSTDGLAALKEGVITFEKFVAIPPIHWSSLTLLFSHEGRRFVASGLTSLNKFLTIPFNFRDRYFHELRLTQQEVRSFSRVLYQSRNDHECPMAILPDEIIIQIIAECVKSKHCCMTQSIKLATRYFTRPIAAPRTNGCIVSTLLNNFPQPPSCEENQHPTRNYIMRTLHHDTWAITTYDACGLKYNRRS